MKPRILLLDIECSPLLSYTWGLFNQDIGLNQIHTDWHLLSFAAKWLGSRRIVYQDLRGQRAPFNDKVLLKTLWKLLNEADIVLSYNGERFDTKKVNARLIMQGFAPPSPYRHIDILKLCRKHFAFTSNKLDYTSKLTPQPKEKSREYVGMNLWTACLQGDRKAWAEMKRYNVQDVRALEALYEKIQSWGTNISFNPYREEEAFRCNCGSTEFIRQGYNYTRSGKFQQYQCKNPKCRAWSTSGINLLSPKKKLSLKGPL